MGGREKLGTAQPGPRLTEESYIEGPNLSERPETPHLRPGGVRALEGGEVPSTFLCPKDLVSQHATPSCLWVPAASEREPIRASDGGSGQTSDTIAPDIARSGCDSGKKVGEQDKYGSIMLVKAFWIASIGERLKSKKGGKVKVLSHLKSNRR